MVFVLITLLMLMDESFFQDMVRWKDYLNKLKFEQGESPALSTVLVTSISLCARIVPKRALSNILYLL